MKIMIGLLHQDWLQHNLVESLLKLRDKYPEHSIEFYFSSARPIDYNRNKIVEYFLSTDNEVLFMMDSDMVIDPNILDMIKEGHDVVSATVFSLMQGIPYPIIMKL